MCVNTIQDLYERVEYYVYYLRETDFMALSLFVDFYLVLLITVMFIGNKTNNAT